MTALGAFLVGLRRSCSHWRIVVPLYAANLIVAALSAIALYGALRSAFELSEAPRAFLEGFDLTTLADMLREHGEGVGSLLGQLPWIIVLYLLVSTFFAGGVLSTLSQRERPTMSAFLHGCAAHAGRFYRLLAAMAIISVLAAVATMVICALLYDAIAGDATSEWGLFWALGLCAGVCAVVAALLVSVSDYARILIVTRGVTRIRESLWGSVRFITSHPLPVAALIVLYSLTFILLTVLYTMLEDAIPGGAVAVWVVAQQLFIASRIWVRVAGCASQLALFGSRWEEAPREEPREDPLAIYRARI